VAVTVYVALLRGVNVGGKSVPMERVRAAFTDAGAQEVRSYIQSGNLVYQARSGTRTAEKAADALAETLGGAPSVFVRTREQWQAVVERDPFAPRGIAPNRHHVTCLDAEPSRERWDAVDLAACAPEEAVLHGMEIHLHTPDGYGRAALTNPFWERSFGVRATTRNWSTVLRLAEMLDQQP
jgi:uncharacterized protein (DUF1697 family)